MPTDGMNGWMDGYLVDDADIHQYMREKREEKIFKWKRLSEQIHKLTKK